MAAGKQATVDIRGSLLHGYDTATLAGDLVAPMDALGHSRFAVAGHDIGVWIGYALAADPPGRVDRLAVAEAAMPGVSESPPLFGTSHANDQLWHFAFNQLAEVNEQLVTGREEIYFGFQFATKAARKLPDGAAVPSAPSWRPGRVILVIVWYLLSDTDARFHDLGTGYYDARTDPECRNRNHTRQPEGFGYKVTLDPAA